MVRDFRLRRFRRWTLFTPADRWVVRRVRRRFGWRALPLLFRREGCNLLFTRLLRLTVWRVTDFCLIWRQSEKTDHYSTYKNLLEQLEPRPKCSRPISTTTDSTLMLRNSSTTKYRNIVTTILFKGFAEMEDDCESSIRQRNFPSLIVCEF